jgi:glucokinase
MAKGVNSEIFRKAGNDPAKITMPLILKAAREGDKLATELVTAAGVQLGVRVAFLVNLFNPEVVVIGGGLEQAGEVLLDAVKTAVRTYGFEEAANAVKVVPSRFGEDAVAVGAAALGIREIFARA